MTREIPATATETRVGCKTEGVVVVDRHPGETGASHANGRHSARGTRNNAIEDAYDLAYAVSIIRELVDGGSRERAMQFLLEHEVQHYETSQNTNERKDL